MWSLPIGATLSFNYTAQIFGYLQALGTILNTENSTVTTTDKISTLMVICQEEINIKAVSK